MSDITDNLERQSYWKEHVNARQNSGLSKARYCREHDLNYHRFIYWADKYSDKPVADCTEPPKLTGKLVPVMLGGSTVSSGLQLHLPNGACISGIDTHSVDLVARLVSQL